MKLLLATRNPGKTIELKQGLQPLIKQSYIIKTLAELKIKEEVEETGTTFKENAILKAKYYADLTGWSTLGDDGGFVIKALKGEPGVKSRRWLGYEANDEELIEYTLKRLKDIPFNKRQAYLEVVLCFFDPISKKVIYETEKINGYVAEKPIKKRVRGFPYRSLLIVKPFNKYYDELSKKEHQQVNHRLKALKRIVDRVKTIEKT